jgi:Ran GTPase-activating protein (RanGAP) involved in mRNA processing and transport
VVAELCGAFCRDSGSDERSTATEKFRHVLITNANDEMMCFQHMRLGTHSGVCLSKVLKGHPLSTLDLFGNVIRDVGAIALLQLVRSQQTIKHLNLGSNDLSHEGGIAIARELGSLQLVSLELGANDTPLHANRFNNKVGIALGEQLCRNTCLRKLGLNGTSLGKIDDKTIDPKQEAAVSLRKTLCLNETLETLALANNSLGTEGCVLILQGLAENATLKDLDVSANQAGAELGVVAGLALSSRAPLTHLSLADNELGPSGGCSLASAMVTCVCVCVYI